MRPRRKAQSAPPRQLIGSDITVAEARVPNLNRLPRV